MAKPVISPYTQLARSMAKLISAASDIGNMAESHAERHAERLAEMRANIAREQGIADGIARHNGTV